MPVGEQVAILYCGTHALMRDLPIDKVPAFQEAFLDRLRASHKADVLEALAAGKLDENVTRILEKEAENVVLSLQ